MRDFKFMHDRYGYIDHDGSMLTIRGEVIPVQEMKRIISTYKGANRLHKPMALLWYTDAMNGKISNWREDSLRK